MEVFFDYACPYCRKAHIYLTELCRANRQIEILWRPCEAHPRPDRYGPHSDLCIRGMFFAQEHHADLWSYHEKMFRAVFRDRINVEDIGSLAGAVGGLLDPNAFRRSLQNGEYLDQLRQSNEYAWDRSGVPAVPSYRMNGKRLDSVEDMGVTKEQLAVFIKAAKNG